MSHNREQNILQEEKSEHWNRKPAEVANIESCIQFIKSAAYKQPQSLQNLLKSRELSELFTSCYMYDDKLWCFSPWGEITYALVNDNNNEVFNLRFFRLSGSDNQFKAFPGYRVGGDSVLKGDEDDPNHNYVQSAKLDPEITKIIERLPNPPKHMNWDALSGTIPEKGGRYGGEIAFSEQQVSLKSESWRKIQECLRWFYQVFHFIREKQNMLGVARAAENEQGEPQDLRKNLENLMTIASSMEKLGIRMGGTVHELVSWLESKGVLMIEKQGRWLNKGDTFGVINKPMAPELKVETYERLRQVYGVVNYYLFAGSPVINQLWRESGLIPDFNDKVVSSYDIDTDGQHGRIMIEEFDSQSTEGDYLRWAMATDSHGRVYVDNVYDPRVGVDTYGTAKLKTNMGILIQKPEDYAEQAWAVPESYLRQTQSVTGRPYVDISRLIAELKPVKDYLQTRPYERLFGEKRP
jgi:hypothetical protein